MNIYTINQKMLLRRQMSYEQQIFLERLRVMHKEGLTLAREAYERRFPGEASYFEALEKLGYILKVGVV